MNIQARVQNTYNLNFEKLKHLKLKNRKLIAEPLFWRNENCKLWCYSKPISNGDSEFWIRIKDDDSVIVHCSTDGLFKEYVFNEFFDLKEINTVSEFILQEELLATINAFIENGILELA